MSKAVEAFSAHASGYDQARRRIVPCYETFYGTAVELVGMRGGPLRRVLDLGAGTGLLGSAVRERHPEIELTLLDGSAEMLAVAAERVPGVRRVVADLREELPGGPFDAIVSSLAIHHLEPVEQADLYKRIARELRPGGVFVNAEHILAPTDWLEGNSRERWRAMAAAAGSSEDELDAADERMALNRCVTVEEELSWLRDAGLQDCDCFFKHLHFAVIAGWRPAA